MNISTFLNLLQTHMLEYKQANNFTYFDTYKTIATEGKKFFKVYVQEITGGKSVNNRIVCFIDKTTGDIFKPATHAAPAKHARGNINSPQNGMEAIGYGGHVNYLRG